MKQLLTLTVFLFAFKNSKAQLIDTTNVLITDAHNKPVAGATVQLLFADSLVKMAITGNEGKVIFLSVNNGNYQLQVSHNSFTTLRTQNLQLPSFQTIHLTLQLNSKTLDAVTVTNKKGLLQIDKGKTTVNVDAAVTNTGSTVLEVLEKSPGVMVDKNGGISLQGKAGVLVMIDDKPTYLSGTELNNLLSSMNAAQVASIELMPNPPAKYDASGNAGIINIKTKKSIIKGFNGTATVSGTQGRYFKSNNSLALNYRSGKLNSFINYSISPVKYYTDLYALRKYYDEQGNLDAILEQPTYFFGRFTNHTVKAGVDYYISDKTTAGITAGGTWVKRNSGGNATANWLSAAGNSDSAIATDITNTSDYRSNTFNVYLRHKIGKQQELAIDADLLNYDISTHQFFVNQQLTAGGYQEKFRGNIPSVINIFSAKADHRLQFSDNAALSSGFKTSHINTDNTTSYQNFYINQWQEDFGRSNRFLYKENIHAVYSSFETKKGKLSLQAGLRYEYTRYNAHQLGNQQQKDSAFSRNYGGLFPSGYLSYEIDSSNTLTLTAGRRLERPPFQVLNPFTSVVNKYTFQSGNPFIIPQYSTNFELSHQYRQSLTTAVSYSIVKNYFSQIFLNDTITGLLYYSQGNVGRTHTLGVSATLMLSPVKWWSFTLQAIYNHKELKGFSENANFHSAINQLNLNMNNQFSFGKIYTGEISGFYTTKARNDIQELLYPIGQFSFGVSRPLLKKKGTIKLSVRDLFHTNGMEGFTDFPGATEYFLIKRDSRVISVAFTYRFGKAYKASKRSSGSAGDEMERVGNG